MANLPDGAARVAQLLLVDLGLGTDPTTTPLGSWPIYATKEPDEPDAVITVYGTAGRELGRRHGDGDYQANPGFQVRVRSTDHPTGAAKAEAIRQALAGVLRRWVTVTPRAYVVHSIEGLGQVLDLGADVPSARGRTVFTVNGVLNAKQAL